MDQEKQRQTPYCFAKLEVVFPMGEDGLRHTPESCMPCKYKVECLRTAMGKPQGLQVKEEMVDRAYSSGVMGFFERWSKKKHLDRKKEDGKRKPEESEQGGSS